jgi:hypothetical protein
VRLPHRARLSRNDEGSCSDKEREDKKNKKLLIEKGKKFVKSWEA